jgi:hypothetical protein
MYKIVIDSCGELPEELKQDGHYETVSKTERKKAETEPLPFVPAMCMMRKSFSGCPNCSNIIFEISTPFKFPNLLLFSIAVTVSSYVNVCI